MCHAVRHRVRVAIFLQGLICILYWFVQWKRQSFLSDDATDITQKTRLTIQRFDQLWESLENLDGKLFTNKQSIDRTSCTASSIESVNLTHIPFRKYSFYGSTVFPYPLNIDLLAKICRFLHGENLALEAIQNNSFRLLVNQPELCLNEETEPIHLLLLIRSGHNQWGRRDTIRKLWANDTCWMDLRVRHLFLVGVESTMKHEQRIQKEALQYRDLIQQDFIDDYYNITYKFMLGLQWALSYCSNAEFLLLIDDDFFVNPTSVSSLFRLLRPGFPKYLSLGCLHRNSGVIRSRSKWAINHTLYPHSNYPNFVSGGSHFISMELALELYVGSRFTRHFPLDDVFTGLILDKLLRATVDTPGVVLVYPKSATSLKSSQLLTLHGVGRPSQQRLLWWRLGMKSQCGAKF